MLVAGSALLGYSIESTDGLLGTVSDLLFDDDTWALRWVVASTGSWLAGRKILLPARVFAEPDYDRQTMPVRLSKAQVEASPDIRQHEPVSMQMDEALDAYYEADMGWSQQSLSGAADILVPMAPPLRNGRLERDARRAAAADHPGSGEQDPHLRSFAIIKGYGVMAQDGAIGNMNNMLLSDSTWKFAYLIVATDHWWSGQQVLVAPVAVSSIDWSARQVWLSITRDQVRSSPPWDPLAMVDAVYAKKLHHHYGWPAFGG